MSERSRTKSSRSQARRRPKSETLYVPDSLEDDLPQNRRDRVRRARQGQRALLKSIRQALRGGPERICQVLNAFHSPQAHFGGTRRRWPEFPPSKNQILRTVFRVHLETLPLYQQSIGRLVLTTALEHIRSVLDQMIKAREPRAERVQKFVLDRLGFMLVRAAKHSRTIDELVPLTDLSERQREELLRADAAHRFYIIAATVLLDLWRGSDDWLRRLRRCGFAKCDRPYFLDRTTSGRARFCGSTHRQADRRRRLKES